MKKKLSLHFFCVGSLKLYRLLKKNTYQFPVGKKISLQNFLKFKSHRFAATVIDHEKFHSVLKLTIIHQYRIKNCQLRIQSFYRYIIS